MLSTLSPLLKCCQSISSRATPAVHGSDEFHVPPREDSVAAALLLVNLVTSQLRPPSLALASPAPVTGATFLNHSATGLSDQMSQIALLARHNSDAPAMLNATTTARHAGAPSPLTEQAKVDAIICLLQLSTHLRPCHLLDRVLPHLVELTGAAGFIASTPSPAGTATAATAAAVDVDLAPGAVSAMGFSTVGPATGGSGGGGSSDWICPTSAYTTLPTSSTKSPISGINGFSSPFAYSAPSPSSPGTVTSLNHSSEVRRLALDSLTQTLRLTVDLLLGSLFAGEADSVAPVSATTTNGAAFFDLAYLTEYLLPSLTGLSLDPDPEVRLAVARCLPVLAEASLW